LDKKKLEVAPVKTCYNLLAIAIIHK